MTVSDVAVLGQPVDVLDGGDVEPVAGRLSVAEIQQALRDFRRTRVTGRDAAVAAPHTSRRPADRGSGDTSQLPSEPPHTSRKPTPAQPPDPPQRSARLVEATDRGGRLGRDWITVVAAHSGAGASCVALAITDAVTASGRPSRLIEVAHPHRSGLVAAANAELGLDATGAWRRGSRDRATLFRRASEMPPDDWPEPAGTPPAETVVDVGLPAPPNIARLVIDEPLVVVVCRVTVPGLRLAEQLITELGDAPTLLAAVGSGRWPGEVTASLGPRVRRLRGTGRVVTVPVERRLQLIGPTNSPLPKSVAAAGRSLLALIDTTRADGSTAPAPRGPRQRGTTR